MKKLLLFVFVLTSAKLVAQDNDIITDRPDQTESSSIVPKGSVQFEAGLVYEKTYSDSIISFKNYSMPSVLIRYGISKNVEARFGIELLKERKESSTDAINTKGISPVMLGTKIKMFEEKKLLPEMSFIAGFIIPFEGEGSFHQKYISPEFRFVMSHTLKERMTLSYNLGGEWNGDTPQATGIYTLALGFSASDNIGIFLESYGFLTQDESSDHRLDAGLTYLILQNLQLDLSSGFGISNISPEYFLAAGISLRLPE
ncbi:MAG: transporter [bacterium]|nr:transporter [bacterium]